MELHQFVWLNLGIKQFKITYYIQMRWLSVRLQVFSVEMLQYCTKQSAQHGDDKGRTKVKGQTWNLQKTLHSSLSQVRYGVSIVSIVKEINWLRYGKIWLSMAQCKTAVASVLMHGGYDSPALCRIQLYRWVSTRLQYLHCWCTEDTTVLHQPSIIELSCLFCMDTFPTST